MTRPLDVQPETIPDIKWLWQLVTRVKRADVGAVAGLRWRITISDWVWIVRVALHGEVQPATEPGEPDRLFGVPVDQVPDGDGRWPELVLACDRRQ